MSDDHHTSDVKALALSLFVTFMCLGFFKYSYLHRAVFFWIGTSLASTVFTCLLWTLAISFLLISFFLICISAALILNRWKRALLGTAVKAAAEPIENETADDTQTDTAFRKTKDFLSDARDPAEMPVTNFVGRVVKALYYMGYGGVLVAFAFLHYMDEHRNDKIDDDFQDFLPDRQLHIPDPSVTFPGTFETIFQGLLGLALLYAACVVFMAFLRLLDVAVLQIRYKFRRLTTI